MKGPTVILFLFFLSAVSCLRLDHFQKLVGEDFFEPHEPSSGAALTDLAQTIAKLRNTIQQVMGQCFDLESYKGAIKTCALRDGISLTTFRTNTPSRSTSSFSLDRAFAEKRKAVNQTCVAEELDILEDGKLSREKEEERVVEIVKDDLLLLEIEEASEDCYTMMEASSDMALETQLRMFHKCKMAMAMRICIKHIQRNAADQYENDIDQVIDEEL